MTRHNSTWNIAIWCILSVLLGFLVAWFDVAAPFGDDSEKGTLLLWLVVCGMLGFIQPHKPWRWAVLVWPWVPVLHLERHALCLPDSIHPNTYTSILALVPVTLAVCHIASFGGSCLRRTVKQA